MKAFPSPHDPKTGTMQLGMELRDYFAAKALQGLLAGWANGLPPGKQASEVAYAYADAMMEARK